MVDATRSVVLGLTLTFVLYGLHTTVFIVFIYYIYCSESSTTNRIWAAPLLTMFTLSTTNFLGTTSFAYGSLVSSGQSIGNPLTWMKVNHQHPDSIIGVVADVLVFLLQDMILLHRLYIVYTLNKYRRSLFVTFLIGILYLMVHVTLLVVQEIWPIGVLEFAGGSQFYIIHCALSSGLHMGMSVAIIIRMVSIRRKIKHVLGDTCTCPYVSVVAMTVESGLAYTIAMTLCSLPVSHTTGAAPVQIIGISACCIAIRVVRGRALTASAVQRTYTSLIFAEGPQDQMSGNSRISLEK